MPTAPDRQAETSPSSTVTRSCSPPPGAKPQSRRKALRAVHTAGDSAGLNGPGRQPVGLHDLRHSLIGATLASGLSLAEAAVLARHASARVTATMYAGVADSTRDTLTQRLADAGYGS